MSLSLSNFKSVIFDIDGVLIDSEPIWKIAMQAVFDEIGCNLTKKDFQKTVGLRLDEVIIYWHQHAVWKSVSPKKVEDRIVQKMVELLSNDGKPLVGVVDTLKHLKKEGVKVGLATSSYSILIDTVLEKLDIREFFDFTHSAELEDFGKPHPAVYLTVAKKLEVSPLDCLVIEDSLNGIVSGKAARMKVVCIPEKTHNPEPKLILADYQFETMSDLLDVIR